MAALDAKMEEVRSTAEKKVDLTERKGQLPGTEEWTTFFQGLLEMCSHKFRSWREYFKTRVWYLEDRHRAKHAGQDLEQGIFDYDKPIDEDMANHGNTV